MATIWTVIVGEARKPLTLLVAILGASFVFTVETGSTLEYYFPRLPGADGSGSSCSIGVGSSTDATGKGDQEHGIGATKEVPGGLIDISTTVDTVMLDSGGKEKDDGDGNDDFQPKSSRKLTRKTSDSRRKFQLS